MARASARGREKHHDLPPSLPAARGGGKTWRFGTTAVPVRKHGPNT